MTDFINFIINNIEPLVFVLTGTILGAAFLTTFYFFVYSYIINKRMRNPEKKHRLKLIMPRFACIIFAVLSLLCSLRMTNKQINIGAYGISTFWQTNYSLVQPDAEDDMGERAEKTRVVVEGDSDFKKYSAQSGYFKYTLYYNTRFSGIINLRSFNYVDNNSEDKHKECEYLLFVDYIGKDSKLNNNDVLEIDAMNLRDTKNYFGSGGGLPVDLEDSPVVFWGAGGASSAVGIDSIIYKKESYDKEEKLEAEEYNEEDYQYLREKIIFDLDKMKFSQPETKMIGN